MARYTGSVCKQCRREGKKLFLKGERCYGPKCSIGRRAYAPGQHGQARVRKASEYGIQLRAKQQAKKYYGILENQFYHYYDMATKKQGVTGENLLRICESRIDNIVYRSGFASSRKEARQLVRHGFYQLNGHKANIPSILLKAGDEVTVSEKYRSNDKMKAVIEANSAHPVPKWLDSNRDNFSVKVIELPNREDIDFDVEEHLIVELYSK